MSKKLIRIEASQPKLLKLYYDLGNVCNYKCTYCFPGSNEGNSGWPDVEKAKKGIVALIKHYYSSGKVDDIELHFLGGEPTLWSDFGELIRYVSNNVKVKICVLTNGSRTIRWWKENAKYFYYIGISVHHESADIDHIIKLGNFLYDSKPLFHTSVLMDNTAWDKCIDILEKLKHTKKKWPVLTKAIHYNGISQYTTEQTKFLQNHLIRWPSISLMFKMFFLKRRNYKAFYSDNTVVKTNTDTYFFLNFLNRYQGWECTLGINYLYITRTGDVTGGCKQKLYGFDGYYNIYDDNFEENFKPLISTVTCEQTICSCSGEAALTKWKKSDLNN
jgi:MoaA/NifB/PqqE/SkfB family radical SAM enzyme